MTNMGRSEKAVGALMNRKNGEHSTVGRLIKERLSNSPSDKADKELTKKTGGMR